MTPEQYFWFVRRPQILHAQAYAAGHAQQINAYDKIEAKSSDGFLNFIEYDAAKISPDKINSYLKAATADSDMFALGGRCTGCRKDNFVLRQLDWYYNNQAEFVIKMKKCVEKGVLYDSIGVTACSPKLTVDIVRDCIASGRYNEYFGMLPYMTVDGVNSAGVFAQSNVVEKNGVYPIDINLDGTDCCCSVMLVRFILDHVGSVRELSRYLSTLHLYSAADKYISYNAHILVCDKTGASKVIEFVKNADGTYGFELVDSNIMTNFRTNGNLSVDSETGKVIWDTVEWNGMGVERWNRCAEFVKLSSANVENFKLLRKDLAYTHAYDRPMNCVSSWITDNLSGDLSVSEAKAYHDGILSGARKELFDSVLDQYRAMYDGRSRETGKTWHTTHSGIYDLVNLSCNLVSQESESESWNILFDGAMTLVNERQQTVDFSVKAYNADTGAEIADPGLSVMLSSATEVRDCMFSDIPSSLVYGTVVALSARPTHLDQSELCNEYYFKGWLSGGQNFDNPFVFMAGADTVLSVGCGYKAVVPTTGGQWVGRLSAADGNVPPTYFFKYDSASGKWVFGEGQYATYVEYDGVWKMYSSGGELRSTETAIDAKEFSIDSWLFRWNESQEEVALSVAAPSDDSPYRNGRLRLGGFDYEIGWPDGHMPLVFKAGEGEAITLSAGTVDDSIVEFFSWSNGKNTPEINLVAANASISVNYDIRKVRILVSVGNESGQLHYVPNALLLINGENRGDFSSRNYAEYYYSKDSGQLTASLSVDGDGAYRFLHWTDSEVSPEEETSLTRALARSNSHSLFAAFEKK